MVTYFDSYIVVAMFLKFRSVTGMMSFRGLSTKAASVVTSSIGDGVQNVTLCSPKTRNALSLEVMTAMRGALAEGAKDRSVRCVVIRGQGPAFSAGHNLKVPYGTSIVCVQYMRNTQSVSNSFWNWIVTL